MRKRNTETSGGINETDRFKRVLGVQPRFDDFRLWQPGRDRAERVAA